MFDSCVSFAFLLKDADYMFNYHSSASAGIRVIVTETKSSCNLSLFSFFFAYVM